MSNIHEVKKITDTIYTIDELKIQHNYLVIGKEHALLIDTGYGFIDIKDTIRQITDLPLIVVNTHGDMDHAGGNYLFEDVYISERDLKILPGLDNCQYKRDQLLVRMVSPDVSLAPGGPSEPSVWGKMDVEAWLNHSIWETRYHLIDDGYVFDLGNRKIEVIAVPGHTSGSIALLDHETGFLFSGDALICAGVYLGDVELQQRYCEPLPVVYHSLKKLKRRQNEFRAIYPAHAAIGISPSIIDNIMIALQEIYEDNSEDKSDINWTGVHTFTHMQKNGSGVGVEYEQIGRAHV